MIALLHEGNLIQIEGAQLAPDKGQAERVKNYARLSRVRGGNPPQRSMCIACQGGRIAVSRCCQ